MWGIKGNMKFLGVMQGSNPKDELIAKTNGSVAVNKGDKVFDKKRKPVGTVKRIFGPVKAPYVSIRPKKKGASPESVGDEFYIDK